MTTEERLKELPDHLRQLPRNMTPFGEECFCKECTKYAAARDLAIKIAVAIAANPRGFMNWMKVTSGVEL